MKNTAAGLPCNAQPGESCRRCGIQVSIGSAAVPVDDANIAWRTDVVNMFADVPAANFNSLPDLRGGGTISGSIQVHLAPSQDAACCTCRHSPA
jgi:hypothetical protein